MARLAHLDGIGDDPVSSGEPADLAHDGSDTAAPVAVADLGDESAPLSTTAVADLGTARPAAAAAAGRRDAPRARRSDRPDPARAELIVQQETGSDPARLPLDDQQRRRRPPGPKQIDPDADPVTAAREICLRLLTDRARTRTELAQALAKRGVPDDAAHAVLDRFDEVGLIDDAAFAGQWVRSRHRNRGLARRAIAQELRRKGVDDEVAGEALAEVDGESEARRARELVDRKLRTMPADTPEQRVVAARRLVGMLARKGYGAGVAYGVVKEALADHGAEADELGDESASFAD